MTGGHVAAERWQSAVASIEAVRARGESVTAAVGLAATELQVSRSTVWARLARQNRQLRELRPRFGLADAQRRAVYATGGNIAAAARAAGNQADSVAPSTRTWQRAVARELSEMEREYARAGWRSARELGLFRQIVVPHRNSEWQTDHKQLGVTVALPDGRCSKPWITAIIDVATRVVQGWAIDLQPTGTTVTCALRRALQLSLFPELDGHAAGGVGGVPRQVRCDNGLEFATQALHDAAAELNFELIWCPPYQPHRKGTVERWNRSLDQMLLAQLPFFDAGPRKADGSLYASPDSMLTLAELVTCIDRWICAYHDRPHAGLGGATPRQAWLADSTPLQLVPDDQLRGLLHREHRMIGKYGIRLNNVYYLPPKLYGMRRKVEVRYDVHAPTELLVYVDGRYRDTAFPQHIATEEQLEQFRQQRRQVVEGMRRDRAAVTRSARLRIQPMTGPGAPVTATVRPAPTERVGGGHPSENPAARARAATTLRPIRAGRQDG